MTEALNEEPLKVTGLAVGRYKLTIDSDEVGTFSEAELAQGVNLAILDTPMSKQAMNVRDLTQKRLDVHQRAGERCRCRWQAWIYCIWMRR